VINSNWLRVEVVVAAVGPQQVRRLIADCDDWFFAPRPARYIALRSGELAGIHCGNYRALIHDFDPHGRRYDLRSIAQLPFEQDSTALLIEVHSRCSLTPVAAREIARIVGTAALAMTSHIMPETMAA
jgi:hypothetical protein